LPWKCPNTKAEYDQIVVSHYRKLNNEFAYFPSILCVNRLHEGQVMYLRGIAERASVVVTIDVKAKIDENPKRV
jgi:hypothetical protein